MRGTSFGQLVGRVLVGLASAFTVATLVFGMVYAAKSSPDDTFSAFGWFEASLLSGGAALVLWVVAVVYATIRWGWRRWRSRASRS